MSYSTITFQEFVAQFPTNLDAVNFVLNSNKQGRVCVSRNTLTPYVLEENQLIALSDFAPNTHSFDVRIDGWYEDGDASTDSVVVHFPYSDSNAERFFLKHFAYELDGVTESSEMHWQENFETSRFREAQALMLQIAINKRSTSRMRIYLIENGSSIDHRTFDANCVSISENCAFEKKAQERIWQLGY